jgi:tetratricopeptide (TPR) repeat protein
MQFNNLIIWCSLSLFLPAYANTPSEFERLLNQADKECQTAQTASMFKALKLARSCISTYESVAEQDPQNKRALVSAIRFHLQAPAVAGGSEDDAKHYLDQLKKIDEEQSQFIWLQFLLGNERQTEAIKIAKELDAKKIRHLATHYFVARAYRQEKDYLTAIAHLEKLQAFTQTPKPQEKWFVVDSNLQLGEALLLSNQPEKAIEKLLIYQNEMKDPKDVHYLWGLWSLAKAYKKANQMQEYQALVKQIKKLDYKKNKVFKREFESGIKR